MRVCELNCMEVRVVSPCHHPLYYHTIIPPKKALGRVNSLGKQGFDSNIFSQEIPILLKLRTIFTTWV